MIKQNDLSTNGFFWRKKTILYYSMAVLVTLLHCSSLSYYYHFSSNVQTVDDFIKYKICMVAVPMFFLLSGMLFFRNYKVGDYFSKLKKRIHTLVIPYLSWNAINMLFAIVTTAFLSRYFVGREAFEWSFQNVFEGIFHYKYYLPLWFLFELIYFVICTPIIELLTRNKVAAPILIALILLLRLPEYLVPRPVFREPYAVIYYLTGAYIGRHWLDGFAKQAHKGLSLLGLGLIAAAIVSECAVDADCYGTFTEIVKVLNRSVYVLGLWWLIDLAVDRIPIRPFMDHSFMIYAIHINISAVAAKLVYFALPKHVGFAAVNYVLTSALTLLVIEGICMLMERYCARLYSVLTGSRSTVRKPNKALP